MKIVVLAGNPTEQEKLLVALLQASLDENQTVHLHNALHSEMALVCKKQPITCNRAVDSTRFYNEQIGLCLTTRYGSPFVGQTIGYSYENFSSTQKALLEKLIEHTGIATNISFYDTLIRNVKDVKYVDTLVIYNVLDYRGVLSAISNYRDNYGKREAYSLEFPGEKVYSLENNLNEKHESVYYEQFDANKIADYVSCIVKGEPFDKTKPVTEKEVVKDPYEKLSNALDEMIHPLQGEGLLNTIRRRGTWTTMTQQL